MRTRVDSATAGMHLHPHLHCVVPGGGLSADERWVACRSGFFLPVRVLSRLFRRLLLEALAQAHAAGALHFFGDLEHLSTLEEFRRYLAPLGKKEWVVYAKPPFGGPRQVLEYLGRYTHRVAISNERLLALEQGAGFLPLERLSPSAAAPSDYAFRRGIYSTLPAACPATGLPAYPLLRLSG